MVRIGCRTDGRTVNEFDEYQPCFFEQGHVEEEFYADMDDISPSEDIWKKFELIPTPPRSPKHEPLTVGYNVETVLNLKMVSDRLDHQSSSPSLGSSPSEDSHNLQSNLIQDCMWSAPGLAAVGLVSSDSVKVKDSKLTVGGSSCSSPTSNLVKCKLTGSHLDINSSECVDPAAVFPYPLNDHKIPIATTITGISLGAETPSESEDSDDEEIDVVGLSEHKSSSSSSSQSILTLSSPHHVSSSSLSSSSSSSSSSSQTFKRKPILPASTSISAQVAAMHNYSTNQPPSKRLVSYSAPHTPSHHAHIPTSQGSGGFKRHRPTQSSPGSPQPYSKKAKLVVTESDLRKVVQKLKMGSHGGHSSHHHSHRHSGNSRGSSDSEDSSGSGDCNKRAQHNVLERKRRNDLKYSFLRLRDHVPDISTQERAPKVTILRKATDFILNLSLEGEQLESELDHHKQVRERLKRKLSALQREML